MPEEINRVLTDQLSDLLFTTELSARDNLLREGIAGSGIHFVGNVMIDTLFFNLGSAVPAARTFEQLGAFTDQEIPLDYGLLTLHRPSNVDDPVVLERLLRVLCDISQSTPLVFPLHPRTRMRIDASGLNELLEGARITTTAPLGYLEMLGLMKDSRFVLTDSGGIQEETTALGVPCITLRENTERPITVTQGSNTVVGTDPEKIVECYTDVMSTGGKQGRTPELWDGAAAERIVAIVNRWSEATAA